MQVWLPPYAKYTHNIRTLVELVTKERTLIQRIMDKLGPGHTIVRDAQEALAKAGKTVSRRTLYQVVGGRSNKPEWVEALLAAAEVETARRADLEARAAKLTA